jgi:hypothetical protein
MYDKPTHHLNVYKTVSRELSYSYHQIHYKDKTMYRVTAMGPSQVIVYERLFEQEEQARSYIESL